MDELIVAGGTLVDEAHAREADLLVADGRVAAILDRPHTRGAQTVVDARGLLVLPGVVDAHVHFNEPGRTHWEGFATGSAAAAAAGVTTVADMPLNSDPPTLDVASLAAKRRAADKHCRVDHVEWGGVVPDSVDKLDELHAAGVVGVKAFLCDSGLSSYPALDDAALTRVLDRAARLQLLVALHAEDAASTTALAARARAQGRRAPLDWAASRPPAAEQEAVGRTLALASRANARIHFVHLSTAGAVRLTRPWRTDGLDVTVETCPHYLALDDTDLDRLGPVAKCAPPLRPRAEVEHMWQLVLDGWIDFIASDHSPCPPAAKQRGAHDIWQAWGGIAGVQTMLPVLLTEGVHRRGLPLPDLVRLVSANPARRLGLFPRKGSLQVGSDADVALVDLDSEWVFEPEHLRTRWPISPFVGRRFRGKVRRTLVRGKTVFLDGAA